MDLINTYVIIKIQTNDAHADMGENGWLRGGEQIANYLSFVTFRIVIHIWHIC